MSNKLNLEKLYIKEKTYKVPRKPVDGQEQIELTFKPIPITSPVFSKFSQMSDTTDMDKVITAMKPIIALSLDIDEAAVDRLDLGLIMELFEIISEVNNFPKAEKESKPDITKFIKDKQELAKNKDLTASIKNV